MLILMQKAIAFCIPHLKTPKVSLPYPQANASWLILAVPLNSRQKMKLMTLTHYAQELQDIKLQKCSS